MEDLLEDLLPLAKDAHRGTSFSPEKRGKDLIHAHNQQLKEDLEGIPEAEHSRYVAGYRKKLTAWLQAKGRCLSAMITGPANFPVRRNEKANRSEENRLQEFMDWHGKGS